MDHAVTLRRANGGEDVPQKLPDQSTVLAVVTILGASLFFGSWQ